MSIAEQELIAAVADESDSDEPRMVYADWLEEQGDLDRAEFIRLDCEHANLPAWDERRQPVLKKIETLWQANQKKWTAGLRGTKVREYDFRRGFLDHVVLNGTTSLQHAGQIFENFPTLQSIKINKASKAFEELLSADWLPRVRRLNLCNNGLGIKRAEQLAACPALANLEQLNVRSNKIGNKGVTALFRSSTLRGLKEIDIGNAELKGLEEALQCFDGPLSKQLYRLTIYNVCGHIDSIDFSSRLLTECRFPKLSYLDLTDLDWGEDPNREMNVGSALKLLDVPEVLNLEHLMLPALPGEFLEEIPRREFRRLLSLSLVGDFESLLGWKREDPLWRNLAFLSFFPTGDTRPIEELTFDPQVFAGLKCINWPFNPDFVAQIKALGVNSFSEMDEFELLGQARDHIFPRATMVCDD